MDKLYYIVCEEGDRTVFEGRFLGRTRGAALKHMKEQLGRSNLIGLVFSITEIPVLLIREIVNEILQKELSQRLVSNIQNTPEVTSAEEPEELEVEPNPFMHPQSRPEYIWDEIKECYMQGRGPKDVARIMNVPINTLKGRIRREGWAHERREVDA
ncbi:MAG: hypothetical protein AB3N63_17950 [Puniceicoccaceae bacterium]